MKTAIAKFDDARISTKDSLILSRELKNLQIDKAKDFLSDLVEKKRNLKRKFFTLTAQKFLEVLVNAEANAKQKDLNLDRTFVRVAKASKAGKMMFPKSRAKFRGRRAKSTNIEIILEER